MKLVPVDNDPFASAPTKKGLTPVDHDPFANEQKPKGQSYLGRVGDILKGEGEAALSMGTGLLAAPVSGLAGIATGGNADVVRAVQERMTYAPKSQEGKKTLDIVTKPLQWMQQGTNWAGEKATDAATYMGASPETSAMIGSGVNTTLNAIPMIYGAKSMKLNKKLKTPTREQLIADSGKAYTTAENAGVVVKNDAYSRGMKKINDLLDSEGIDPKLHPDTVASLERLSKREIETPGSEASISRKIVNGKTVETFNPAKPPVYKNPTFEKLEQTRRVLQSAVTKARKSGNLDDARLADKVLDEFDNYVETMPDTDIAAGDLSVAKPELLKARELWKRNKKTEVIQDILEQVKNRESTSGFEAALRSKFRTLADNKNKMRQFTPDEVSAIQDIVRGDATYNTFATMAKLFPNTPWKSFAELALVVAHPTAAVIPLIGAAAKAKSGAMAAGRAKVLEELVRRGQKQTVNEIGGLKKGTAASAAIADELLKQKGAK